MEAQIDKYLYKVLNSESFTASIKTRDLFTYLLQCSIKGTPPKEIQIALDVFKRNLSENNNESTIVRVNVHNLRRKLNHYYLTEGLTDEIIFNIPTGHYQVEITQKKSEAKIDNGIAQVPENKSVLSISKKQSLIYLIIVVSTALITYFITGEINESESTKIARSLIWKDFTKGEKKTMLVIGDYYFYNGKKTDFEDELIIRNFNINSDEDFANFLSFSTNNGQKYGKAQYGYTSPDTPIILKDLLPILSGIDYEVCLMSQFNAKYLMQYNIIFVGLYQTIGVFNMYFNHSQFQLNKKIKGINTLDKNSRVTHTYIKSGKAEKLHNDYSIVAKFPGPNKNSIMIFTGFEDTGLIESVRKFTKAESLTSFTNELKAAHLSNPSSFELLIEVIGIDRNGMKSKIIQINSLDSTSVFGDLK